MAIPLPMKSHSALNFSFPPVDSVDNGLSHAHKRVPLLCCSWLVCDSPLHHVPWIAILWCSQISPFCWRNTWLFVIEGPRMGWRKCSRRRKNNYQSTFLAWEKEASQCTCGWNWEAMNAGHGVKAAGACAHCAEVNAGWGLQMPGDQ